MSTAPHGFDRLMDDDHRYQLAPLDRIQDKVLILNGKLASTEAKLTAVKGLLEEMAAYAEDPPLDGPTFCTDMSRDELTDLAYAYEEYWWKVKGCIDRINDILKGEPA